MNKTFEAITGNAALVFSNDPADRLTGDHRAPVRGVTGGKNHMDQLNGTVAPGDIALMFAVMCQNGWLESTRGVNILIYDPNDPSHAVLAKSVRVGQHHLGPYDPAPNPFLDLMTPVPVDSTGPGGEMKTSFTNAIAGPNGSARGVR